MNVNFLYVGKFAYLLETIEEKNGLRKGDVIFIEHSLGDYFYGINLQEEYERIFLIYKNKLRFVKEVVLDMDYYINNNIYPFLTFGHYNKPDSNQEEDIPLIITKSCDDSNLYFHALDAFWPYSVITVKKEDLNDSCDLYPSFYLFEVAEDSRTFEVYGDCGLKNNNQLLLLPHKKDDLLLPEPLSKSELDSMDPELKSLAEYILSLMPEERDPRDKLPFWMCFDLKLLTNYPVIGADMIFTNNEYMKSNFKDSLIYVGNI